MRNKTLIIIIALLILIVFGGVSTADAFVDPITTALVLTGVFVTTALIVKQLVKNHEEPATAQVEPAIEAD